MDVKCDVRGRRVLLIQKDTCYSFQKFYSFNKICVTKKYKIFLIIYSNGITHDNERKLGVGGGSRGMKNKWKMTYNFSKCRHLDTGLKNDLDFIVSRNCLLWPAHGQCACITNADAFVYSMYDANARALCSCCAAGLHCALCAVHRHP